VPKLIIVSLSESAEMTKKKANVLIVDDKHENLFALEKVLGKLEVNITKANSGNEALIAILNTNFAIILLDVQMPGMDGYEVLEIMRTKKSARHIPVIFLTAVYSDDEHKFKGYKSGAVDFIYKPFNEEILLSKVKFFLDLYGKKIELEDEITKRKKIEEKLRQQSQIIDQIHDAVISTSLTGEITGWNKGAERMFGYTRQNAVGKHISIIYPDKNAASGQYLQDGVLDILREKGFHNLEVKRCRNNGICFYVHLSLSLIKDHDGNTKGVIGYSIDITKRKLVEAALENSNAALEQFAHDAAHDLQEPLRMVTSYLTLLERRYKPIFDSDGQDFIMYAVDGAKRMKLLINDLLAYSKLDATNNTFTEVDCEKALKDAVSNLMVAIRESGAVITHDKLPTITGNKSQLSQLFQNIISNSIKFNKSTPSIHISAKRDKDIWSFSMRDNGIGMEQEDAKCIFTIFKRLHSKREYTGSGIGLAICQKTVQRHGGEIWVESETGKGSTFYFTISCKTKQEKNLPFLKKR